MSSENFIDKVKIYCESGDGGSGIVHFHRTKFINKGGPDGGNGGNGGNIILEGDNQISTLLHFKYNRHFKAKKGFPGKKNRMNGAYGKDIILKVPLGTIIKDEKNNIITEINKNKEKKILFYGGKGGLGNWNFKNSINQSPKYSQIGLPGKKSWIFLELKLLADVGLVGMPNSGKSTLLSSITSAKPKISNYKFTTLSPQLGVVKYYNENSFIIADIPGIIKDSSKGKGIGYRFLRHIERNSVLLFIIASNSKNILKEYNILLKEIKSFNINILNKKNILVISKIDLLNKELIEKLKINLKNNFSNKLKIIFISSIFGIGLKKLKNTLWGYINN